MVPYCSKDKAQITSALQQLSSCFWAVNLKITDGLYTCLWDAGVSFWATVPFILHFLWPHLHISQSFWDFLQVWFCHPKQQGYMFLFYFYAFKNKQTLESDNLAENIFLLNVFIIKQVKQGVIVLSWKILRVSCNARRRKNIILFLRRKWVNSTHF